MVLSNFIRLPSRASLLSKNVIKHPLLSPRCPRTVHPVSSILTRSLASYSDELEPVDLFDSPKKFVSLSPIISMRNMMFNLLIRGYFDSNYSLAAFKSGAIHSLSYISQLMANKQFDEMEGLVTKELITKLRHRCMDLNEQQNNWLSVSEKDCVWSTPEVGVILIGDQRFVEITLTVHGVHGFQKLNDIFQSSPQSSDPSHFKHQWTQHFQCSYRFIRDYSKGKEDSWTINQLNHFLLIKQIE